MYFALVIYSDPEWEDAVSDLFPGIVSSGDGEDGPWRPWGRRRNQKPVEALGIQFKNFLRQFNKRENACNVFPNSDEDKQPPGDSGRALQSLLIR